MKKHIQKIGVVRWIGRLYIFLGLLFVLVSVCIYGISEAHLYGMESTDAVILLHDSSASETEVEYVVNGHTYTCTLRYYSSTQEIGDTIRVYYDTDAPQKASSRFVPGIVAIAFGVVSLIFAVIGMVMVAMMNRNRRRRQALFDSGLYIDAEIRGVTQNYHVSFNRYHPYVIICEAQNPQDGKTYTFKSEDYWDDPSPMLSGLRTLRVAVDPENYKHYAMDTAFLQSVEFEES